ncbi:MAG TPA: glycosyltransferase family 39 protein [Candidatus Binatia bacterium]
MELLFREERYHLPFLFLFSGVLYLAFLGGRDLWAPVEPRYGEIARVMFEGGRWIVPTVNGAPYTDKPILYFWFVLLLSHLFGGVNEWTVRLPSALSAIGLVLVTYRMGREFFSPQVGLLSSLVIATAFRVFWEGRWAHTDMLLTLCLTGAFYNLLRLWHGRGGLVEVVLGYGLMGLATLTKGMIGFVLPGLVFLVLLIMSRRNEDWLRLRLIPGVGIFLLVTLPWFVAVAAETEGTWIREFIWNHHVQRFIHGSGHRRPFYYYLVNFPADFLPWTPFLLPATLAAWRRRGTSGSPTARPLLVWAAVVFIFFSLSNTKRELYLIPMYPPVALWLGYELAAGDTQERNSPLGFAAVTALYTGLLTLVGLFLPMGVYWLRRELLGPTLPVAGAMAVGSLAAYCSFRKSRLRAGTLRFASMFLATALAGAYWVFPVINLYKSPRIPAEQVKHEVGADTPLSIYADSMNDFNFYLRRAVIPVVSTPEELKSIKDKDNLQYLLIREKDRRRIPPGLWPPSRLVTQTSKGNEQWDLYRFNG